MFSLSVAGRNFVMPLSVVNFPVDQLETTVTIPIIPRASFTGNLEFVLKIRSNGLGAGALEFTNSATTVLIVDEQGGFLIVIVMLITHS